MKKFKVDVSYICYRLYRHGFVVKTEKGTRCLNSSVMYSAKGGLEITIHSFTLFGATLDEAS